MKDHRRALRDFLRSGWDRFLRFTSQRPFFSFALTVCLALSFVSLAFEFSEHDGRSQLWRAVVYMTSGIDVDPPETILGKFIATVSLIVGVFFVSLITGYAASEFSRVIFSSQIVQAKPFRRIFEKHVLLIGWGAKAKAILRELNPDYELRDFTAEDIVVVSPEGTLDRGQEKIYQSVWHVKGQPTDADVLRAADLTPDRGAGAQVAVILSDTSISREEADQRSLLTLLAVEHLHPEVISIVEVQDETGISHFLNANADEVVAPNEYAALLLARTAAYPGLASYVEELLALGPVSFKGGQSGRTPVSFYVISAQDAQVEGKSLPEAILRYNERTSGMIVGTMNDNGFLLFSDNADPSNTILSSEDELLVISTPELL